jgi:FdhE protein
MSSTATIRVKSAEEIAATAGGETPFLRFAARNAVFAERAMRLRQVAAGHAMGDFLRFMADLASAQQAALASMGPVVLPDAAALDRAARDGVPPLAAADWPRDAAWHGVARALAAAVHDAAPAAAQPALDTVQRADDEWLERQADCLLTGVMQGLDLAAAPIVAAALQVYWAHMVLTLQDRAEGQRMRPSGRMEDQPFGRVDDALACPCCGSRPTASLTVTAGGAPGQRYLHCSVCSTQWHVPRIRCTHCGSEKHIAFQSLDAADRDEADDGAARAAQAAVQAETCDDCGHYLKIMHTDRDPFVDPVADDLASVTLDLLVSQGGWQRHGVNLMLLYGEPPPEPGAA